MRIYWRERRAGQSLILCPDDGAEVEVGTVRRTPRGFDALAKTNTYDPGRSQRGFAGIEEAKAFVESFHPWDLFGGNRDLAVDPEVQPMPTEGSEATAQQASHVEDESSPGKPGWQFWKKG
jgi:hypothetical protein